jgi:superfamily II DNA or RNA helicase
VTTATSSPSTISKSELYDFQIPVRKDAREFLLSASPGQSRLYSSPTGSGKTAMQVWNLQNIPELVQLVPSLEIARGFVNRLEQRDDIFTLSEQSIRQLSELHNIYTYQRYCNLLRDGKLELPRYLQIDEAHHAGSEREKLVWEYCNRCPRIGFTATPYRGTPVATKEFLDDWGNEYTEILSLKQAVNRGVIAHPQWFTWPLIDDDLIDISNGDFSARSVEKVVDDVLEQLVIQTFQLAPRPTMVSLTSESLCRRFVELAKHHGHSATAVVSGTTDRQQIFRDVLACKTVLVQIRVVGEGVDLPLRRLIDAAPTMSPVLWQQRVGRITRPTNEQPEYYAACMNLTRHAYLWHGVMPAKAVRDSQAAFGHISKRDAVRGLGQLTGLGRFTPAPIPLSCGLTGSLYSLQSPDGMTKVAVLMHPLAPDPIYGLRRDIGDKRGTWERIPTLPDVKGWVSTHNSPLTPKMEAFYRNYAPYVGLDGNADVNARSFQAMPFLKDLRLKLLVPEGQE